MSILENFHTKDFVEQVNTLLEIEKNKIQDAIPDLFEICKKSDPSDQALFMAENTLRSLLKENEAKTVEGIASESSNIRKICIQTCIQKKFLSATPVLISLAEKMQTKSDIANELFDVLSALFIIEPPESIEFFRKNLSHPNPMIAELSVEAIGNMNDTESIPKLVEIVKNSEADENLAECDIITASAIESLGKMKADEALSFLSSAIHHKNPNTRRIVHQVLVELGEEIIPNIASFFDEDDVDSKIMTANVLGLIGGKKAGDILVNAIDRGVANHPNILFAIYEALGNIPSIKSIVCLSDGLTEEDELILIAVLSSINRQLNPGVLGDIKKLIETGDDQSQRIVKAIISSKSLNIFEAFYENDVISNLFISAIKKSNNKKIIAAFYEKLREIGSEKAIALGNEIRQTTTETSDKRILAVDDSKAMVLFYQSTISEMGLTVETAINGQEAYDKIESDNVYDLVVTDMNMPQMNGIELTKKIREHETMGRVPIIMATTESDSSQVDTAKKAGVSYFIKKPFTADDLKQKITDLFS